MGDADSSSTALVVQQTETKQQKPKSKSELLFCSFKPFSGAI